MHKKIAWERDYSKDTKIWDFGGLVCSMQFLSGLESQLCEDECGR